MAQRCVLKDQATGQIKKVADRVEGLASSAADQVREVGDPGWRSRRNMKSAIDKSVKDQPMATLAIAAMVGFVLDAIWKS